MSTFAAEITESRRWWECGMEVRTEWASEGELNKVGKTEKALR
ncbi:MAG: hypothetical protein ACI3VY_05685 [Faecousia sp.]